MFVSLFLCDYSIVNIKYNYRLLKTTEITFLSLKFINQTFLIKTNAIKQNYKTKFYTYLIALVLSLRHLVIKVLTLPKSLD